MRKHPAPLVTTGRFALMVLAISIAGMNGCTDSSAPRKTLPTLPGLVFSEPVQPVAAAGIAATYPGLSVSTAVVYVSLLPGAVPAARSATIRDQESGEVVSTPPILNGGFDPVGLQASVGDTLIVEITVIGSTEPVIAEQVVSAGRPPVVVRTEPAPKRVDVPLNASLVVVFSEPLDPVSLPRGVYLLRGSTFDPGQTLVPGQLEFLDPAHLSVVFTPAADLAAQTIYTLAVSPVITGADGLPLETAFEAEFTTGSSTTGIASVSVLPETVTVSPGSLVQLNAVVRDNQGTVLSDQGIAWASSAESVATVAANGMVTTHASGSAIISATAGGKAGTGRITVTPLAPTGGVWSEVSTGSRHSCGVTTSGAAYCWGGNDAGQLGNGSTINSSTPVAVAGGLTFAAVSAGTSHSCGVTTGGVAYCWGFNNYGQLGNGSTAPDSTPVAVSGGLTFTSVSAAEAYTCGVTAGGAAYCWGFDPYGLLGNGSTAVDSTPVAVLGGLAFATISAGLDHRCGVTTSGVAYCWGYDGNGQLGNGSLTASGTPVAVTGGLTFTLVSAGKQDHSCGVTNSGAAYCWGLNYSGQLGNGSTAVVDSIPLAVSGGLTLASVSAGPDYSCGVTTGGAAYCWGTNLYGQLGNGSTAYVDSIPVAVSGGLTFAAVSAGGPYHSCGVTTDGAAYCWGDNTYGQLGNGTTTGSNTPVPVHGP